MPTSPQDTDVTYGRETITADGTTLRLMTTTDGDTVDHYLALTASDAPLTREAARELGTLLLRFSTGGARLWGQQ